MGVLQQFNIRWVISDFGQDGVTEAKFAHSHGTTKQLGHLYETIVCKMLDIREEEQ